MSDSDKKKNAKRLKPTYELKLTYDIITERILNTKQYEEIRSKSGGQSDQDKVSLRRDIFNDKLKDECGLTEDQFNCLMNVLELPWDDFKIKPLELARFKEKEVNIHIRTQVFLARFKYAIEGHESCKAGKRFAGEYRYHFRQAELLAERMAEEVPDNFCDFLVQLDHAVPFVGPYESDDDADNADDDDDDDDSPGVEKFLAKQIMRNLHSFRGILFPS